MMAANPSVLIVCSFFIQVASGYLFGPGQVTGSLGGSVTVSCYYSSISANIHGRKYWCKMRGGQCYTIVSTTPYLKQNYVNRAYLQDLQAFFTINMTGLQYSDAGPYRCGIGDNNKKIYYPVSLIISQGKNVPSSSEVYIGKLRGSLDIRCPVPRKFYNGTLYWCKVSNTRSASCDTIINNSGKVNSHFWGRVLIQKERNATTFSVLVNELRTSDSGFYRCGASSHTNESVWKDVHVHIINEPTRKKIFRPPMAGESLRVNCQVPKDFGPRAETYWCKWSPRECPPLVDSSGFIRKGLESRISLIPDNSTIRAYTVVMNHLEAGDSGSYWCVTSNGSRVASSSINVDVLAVTTKVYPSHTSSPDMTSIRTPSTDLVPITDTTAVLYSQLSTRGQSSTEFSTVPSNPLSPTDSRQDTTAVLYSQSSTGGQSSTEFSTVPSNPLSPTDHRQGTTTVLYSKSSTRGQSSTEFSTVPSNPLIPTDRGQDSTAVLYSQSSTRGQSSTEFSMVPFNPLSPTDSSQDTTAVPYSQSSTRGQSSTEFSTVPFNPPSSTDSGPEVSTIQKSSTDSVTLSPIYTHSSSATPSSWVTLQDTTAVLYPQSSTRGQSSTEFSTAPSTPPSSSGSRQDTTAVLHSHLTTRGQSSTEFSTVPSKPLGPTDSRQDTTSVLYSQSSTRGQSSTEFSTVPSNPVSPTDSRQATSSFSKVTTRGQSGGTPAPVTSSVPSADGSMMQYLKSSTRGQQSTEYNTASSKTIRGTESRQGHSPPVVLSPTSRPAAAVSSSSSASVSHVRGTNSSRSRGTHATYRSGAMTTTVAPQRTSATTHRTGNSPLYSQPVSGKNESSSESLVSRPKNLLLIIIIPALVIACGIIFGALFAVLVKVKKSKAAKNPTINQEHIAMIGEKAKLEDAQHNDNNALTLANPEDLSGETDV